MFKSLDLEHSPELYVYQDFYINAYTTGHEQDAFIVLSSGGVDRLSEAELEFVIGHESVRTAALQIFIVQIIVIKSIFVIDFAHREIQFV